MWLVAVTPYCRGYTEASSRGLVDRACVGTIRSEDGSVCFGNIIQPILPFRDSGDRGVASMEQYHEKFQWLLRELFQFDLCAVSNFRNLC